MNHTNVQYYYFVEVNWIELISQRQPNMTERLSERQLKVIGWVNTYTKNNEVK